MAYLSESEDDDDGDCGADEAKNRFPASFAPKVFVDHRVYGVAVLVSSLYLLLHSFCHL